MRRAGKIFWLGFRAAARGVGFGDGVHGICRRGAVSGALVSAAGRTAARARLRPAAVAAVEKVGVKIM